jgi:hypothetical protein
LIIDHICLCWLSKRHPTIYPTSKNQFEGQGLVTPSVIIPSDNVENNVKRKLDFDESKSISKQKPF